MGDTIPYGQEAVSRADLIAVVRRQDGKSAEEAAAVVDSMLTTFTRDIGTLIRGADGLYRASHVHRPEHGRWPADPRAELPSSVGPSSVEPAGRRSARGAVVSVVAVVAVLAAVWRAKR